MNGRQQAEDASLAGPPSFSELSDNDGEEDNHEDNGADYSTRFEELMNDGEDGSDDHHEEADEEEGFFYSGVDAEPSGGYKEQLRDVLGPEHEEDDDMEEVEVEKSLLQEVEENEKFAASMEDEARHADLLSDVSRSVSPASHNGVSSPPGIMTSDTPSTPSLRRPFLHPTISRLRSMTPQASRSPSVGSIGTLNSHMEDISAAQSNFSALSRNASSMNLHETLSDVTRGQSETDRQVFKWTQLRIVGDYIYGKQPVKASAVLGSPSVGSPTVLAANGLVCIGTDSGKVLVFDFKQNLKCICGDDSQVGPVTALALSFDHTFIAVGHATGHIQLFDVRNPKVPARFVSPTSLAEVAAGTQEGHLLGSRIVSVGFIAGRHTAIVSADDTGMAFYHSLGKVLFVDASDILRILGKYPDEDHHESLSNPAHHHFRRRKTRRPNTILSMAPLPLGTSPHPTDAYNLIALLTPVKLVIVGLKPSPKTWYRRHRESVDEPTAKSRNKGTMAWYPSVSPANVNENGTKSHANGSHHLQSTPPMLVYTWGNVLNLIKVSETKVVQTTRNSRTGKTSKVEEGRIVFEESGRWTTEGDVLATQWLNVNQVIVLTSTTLEVHDVRTMKMVEHVHFDAWSLVSPILSHTTNGTVSYSDAVTEVSHSVRVYKGKIFLLGQREVQVGTLLTWADRILSFVEDGDFLSAIELTRSYFVGEAPGNRNGLPDKPGDLKAVVGEKMRELMVASARYAFSEERMTDGTHVTPDGRGVDRTSLFEGLVVTCARACIALDDFDFLFEELYQDYDNNGITRMFLLQLEPFILDGRIHQVPPRITQRLVALHDDDHRPDLVERVIWHIDPDCLDINQAITLCQNYQLYDALIYVFTRALKDYVSPVVELLGLIRKVQQFRRARAEASPTSRAISDDVAIESDILNAYKIYPYLANILTGLTYPSEEPLPEDEAFRAKKDVYTFLFFGRSSVWPIGEGGKLILTSDEENGVEPTYPYTRLLLRFDAESFLHTLDIAFEDAYLNDKSQGVSRLVIIKILFEILSSPELSVTETTFVNIFIARNVPKYPQFIQMYMSPSALQGILIGLADSPDESTREDRQLAAEYLLSVYTPHESDHILRLFEDAGFYRILRTWHLQERQWIPLLQTYLQDPNLPPAEVFPSVDNVLTLASKHSKGALPPEILSAVSDSLPTLLRISVTRTASLVDSRVPGLHEKALEALGERANRERFIYLRFLLGSPQRSEEEQLDGIIRKDGPSAHVSSALRQEYISLLCEMNPSAVVSELQYLPSSLLDWSHVLQTCEDHQVYDAVIWTLDHRGDPAAALAKVNSYTKMISNRIVQTLISGDVENEVPLEKEIASLKTVGATAVKVCLERSQSGSRIETPLDDLWFSLLKSQILCVHRLSLCCSQEAISEDGSSSSDPKVQRESRTLHTLRGLVKDTFTSLMSISSTTAVSFPRLFKRLVDSTTEDQASKGAVYNEFRVILTGMLESYRSDGDMLIITKHLVDRDLFLTIEELAKSRAHGWAPSQGICSSCKESLYKKKPPTSTISPEETPSDARVIISRTGAIYHDKCLPPDFYDNARNVH